MPGRHAADFPRANRPFDRGLRPCGTTRDLRADLQRKWGNPILFDRRFIEEIKGLTGDRGARHLLDIYPELTCEVAMPDDAILVDVDTPEALAKLAI